MKKNHSGVHNQYPESQSAQISRNAASTTIEMLLTLHCYYQYGVSTTLLFCPIFCVYSPRAKRQLLYRRSSHLEVCQMQGFMSLSFLPPSHKRRGLDFRLFLSPFLLSPISDGERRHQFPSEGRVETLTTWIMVKLKMPCAEVTGSHRHFCHCQSSLSIILSRLMM